MLSAEIQRAVSNGAGSKSILTLILGLDPGLQHVELQLADHAHDPVAADHAAEHLGHALLGQIFQRALELLGLHRVLEPHAPQDLGREVGDAGEA